MARANFNPTPGDEISQLSEFSFGLPDSQGKVRAEPVIEETPQRESRRAENSSLGEFALALVLLAAAAVTWFGWNTEVVKREFPQLASVLHLADGTQKAAGSSVSHPQVRVWADLNTALYYCSGSAYYGRTKNGRFMTQAEAESGHFESAERRECTAPLSTKIPGTRVASR